MATVINNGTGDSDDNVSARAGFTFKLGKVVESPKVTACKTAALHDELEALRTANTGLMALLKRLEKSLALISLRQVILHLGIEHVLYLEKGNRDFSRSNLHSI